MSTNDWMSFLFMGLPLIVIGMLVVRFPMMISGYNTLPKAQREKVDIKGLSRMMRRYLIFMGIGAGVLPVILRKMDYASAASLSPIVFILGLAAIASVKSRRYLNAAKGADTSAVQQVLPRRERVLRKYLKIFLTIVLGLFLIQFVRVLVPSKVEVGQTEIVITGAYGLTILADEIQDINLQDHLWLTMRTNGVAVGNFYQGHFRSKEWGPCLVFLRNARTSPYVIIALKNSKTVVVNCKTPEQTKALYSKILEMSDK